MKRDVDLQELIEKNRETRIRLSNKTPEMPPHERNDRVGKIKRKKQKILEKLEKSS